MSAFRALDPKNAIMKKEYGTENEKLFTSHFVTVLASDASLILSEYALLKKYCQTKTNFNMLRRSTMRFRCS